MARSKNESLLDETAVRGKNAGRTVVIEAPSSNPIVIDVMSSESRGEAVTCYLFIEPNNESAIDKLALPNILATVEWGNDGYQTSAFADVGVGMSFTVCAAFLRVKAKIDPQTIPLVLPVPFPTFVVGGHVSYGIRPGTFRAPTRTLIGEALALGFTPILSIPSFARSMTLALHPNPAVAIAHFVEFFNIAGALISVAVYPRDTLEYPIPVDAKEFRVFNASAVGVTFRTMFELAL